jgi:hypothetical protein
MRKFLTFLIAVAAVVGISASSFAQGFNGGCFNCGCPACAGNGGRTCTDDTASTNFLARTSGLSNTEADAYCNMIKGLETDSIITGNLSGANGCGTVIDALWIFATKNVATANLNICGTNYTINASAGTTPMTFTADTGYTGNGSDAYINTSYVPSTSGLNYAQNSASFGVCILNNRTTGLNQAAMGNGDTGLVLSTHIIPWWSDNNQYISINAPAGGFQAATTVKGMWVLTRTAASGAGSTQLYLNGTANQANAGASASNVQQSFLIAARRSGGGGVVSDNSADTFGGAFIGVGMNATQAGNISTRFSNLMTALGHTGCG